MCSGGAFLSLEYQPDDAAAAVAEVENILPAQGPQLGAERGGNLEIAGGPGSFSAQGRNLPHLHQFQSLRLSPLSGKQQELQDPWLVCAGCLWK